MELSTVLGNLVLTCSGVPVRSFSHVAVLPRLCISTQWSTINPCWHFFLTHTLHMVRFVHHTRNRNCSSVFCGTFQEVMHWGKALHVFFFFLTSLTSTQCAQTITSKLFLHSAKMSACRPPFKWRHCASKKNLLPSVYDVVATSLNGSTTSHIHKADFHAFHGLACSVRQHLRLPFASVIASFVLFIFSFTLFYVFCVARH